MGRVRDRIGDKRVLRLVKAFLKAGVLAEDGSRHRTITGTPQGGILSPLLANIALSVLDEHFTQRWEALGPAWTRAKRRRAGESVARLVRYADDFVIMVGGTRDDAETLKGEVAAVLAPMGLRLSDEKTRVCHIDEGFELGGLAYPTAGLAKPKQQEGRLHLPIKEVTRFCRGQGPAANQTSKTSNALRPATPTEPASVGAGATTSVTEYQNEPSATSTTTPSGASSPG